MTNNHHTDREVPEEKSRKQIQVPRRVREYIKRRSEETGKTYSELVSEWIPDDTDRVHYAFKDEDVVFLKATPGLHADVMSMVGPRVKPGQVVAFHAMMNAVEEDDAETATEFAEFVPELLWMVLETEGPDNGGN